MAEAALDVVQKALEEIRRRYQSLEGRVKNLERGAVTPSAAEDAGTTRPDSVQSP